MSCPIIFKPFYMNIEALKTIVVANCSIMLPAWWYIEPCIKAKIS
jgi:hypothetical protein